MIDAILHPKRTYAETVRNLAINSLIATPKLSRTTRRRLQRSAVRVTAIGAGKDPVKVQAKLERKIAGATHVQRCRWFRRLSLRIAGLDFKIVSATAQKMDTAVKLLTTKRNQLDRIRGAIGSFFAEQAYKIAFMKRVPQIGKQPENDL